MFPAARGARITHRWGGVIGVPRDWMPRVGYEPARRLAWAGGYVGDGVGSSALAGRTLADLVLGRATDLVSLPLVGPAGQAGRTHQSPPGRSPASRVTRAASVAGEIDWRMNRTDPSAKQAFIPPEWKL